ncbi:hypothetical protein AB0I81_59585 [Nonomuraea sp. NPDC050404]|uniref:hypothetical protein n=1 Tax=Nonomuraea sp. NPDC050404 TaxID=3155783 RepID=UPI0033F771DB
MKALAVRAVPLLAVTVVALAGCGVTGPASRAGATVTVTASPPPAGGTPTTRPFPDPSPPRTPPTPGDVLIAGHYQPLWPFSSPQEVATWQRAYHEDGAEPWHLDPKRTAIAFTRDFLGFTEIDLAIKTRIDGSHARVHVGMDGQEGRFEAAVVHLMKYGPGKDAPWEVVGTDDTKAFTLTKPAYGAAVGSPLAVGGRIRGVDESITVEVRHPGSKGPLGKRCCVPAGGVAEAGEPWSARVSFTAKPGSTLTIVAHTGGHVATVERFAITGVTLPL